ncbi:hypothetical protein HLH26_18960 [Gluconacetobacter sp. 1b LMG 1731]|uniref:Lipoprotein n=1 Tax=Gluconacetobacter dulcium TaxID=2729096 RepID=A0A7W4IP89_9PROT|nr:hypothetical protein [Gluconacetobacter dulcium]MBB2166565.1 hypothetical protein [Gluconacetobacter dulcium]MBB2195667.1 hypothetical protein [Gluconacetobacter dulcium]
MASLASIRCLPTLFLSLLLAGCGNSGTLTPGKDRMQAVNAAFRPTETGQKAGHEGSLGTFSISLRGGTETRSLVVSTSGTPVPWSQFTEIPYVGELDVRPGKPPVSVGKIFHDGMSGTVSAVVGTNHHVTLRVDLTDEALLKMDRTTLSGVGTIDCPVSRDFEFHGVIDLADGESATLGTSGEAVWTVSWRSL